MTTERQEVDSRFKIEPEAVKGDMLGSYIDDQEVEGELIRIAVETIASGEELRKVCSKIRKALEAAFTEKGTAPTGSRLTWIKSGPQKRTDQADLNNIAYSITLDAANKVLQNEK
jgi:hypothetical protein